MIVLIKNDIKIYSANKINKLTLNEKTSFFTNIDGNSNECKFVGEYKDLINLGYKIHEEEI